jgi:hypothetical protein
LNGSRDTRRTPRQRPQIRSAGRRSLALAIMVAFGIAVPASGAVLPAVVVYIGPQGDGSPAVRPANIVYTGDDSGFFGGPGRSGPRTNASPLDWTQWGESSASGTGADWLDNCEPDCAGGKFTAYPVKLKLTRPATVGGYYVFTRMRVTYLHRIPAGTSARSTAWVLKYGKQYAGFDW